MMHKSSSTLPCSKGAKHVADAQPSWPKLHLLDLDDNELSSEGA